METTAKPEIEKAAQNSQAKAAPVVRKFEIAVYDISINDDTGKEEYRPIAYSQPVVVEASSLSDLKSKLSIYRQCGQFAKVIREIDPPANLTQNAVSTAAAPAAPVPVQSSATSMTIRENEIPPPAAANVSQPKQKPRIYRLGDIEIKDDNGKIYQKQWMKLTDNEAANFRVINDKNNSIVTLAGKHIEMKKWVLVENIDEDETSSIEENLS